MAKSLSDYLQTDSREKRLIQVKINPDLFKKFNAIRTKRKIKWITFIEAAIQKFLDENPS